MEFVEEHNNKSLPFKCKINKYGDLTSEEFSSLVKGFKPSSSLQKKGRKLYKPEFSFKDSPNTTGIHKITFKFNSRR